MVAFRAGTQIETNDGLKAVEILTRGDMIKTTSGFVPLARLMVSEPSVNDQYFVLFPQHCTGNNVPNLDLYVTKHHLMVFDYKLLPCEQFVGKVENVSIEVLQEKQYNLIFETQEYIHVHGLLFVTHHPNHPVHGLQHDEYFDPLKYRPGVFYEMVTKYVDIFT
jgi:hypothetical protein